MTTDSPERHADVERNRIINRCDLDLRNIIQGFDPGSDNLDVLVWDRLDKMAMEIEARRPDRSPAPAPEPMHEDAPRAVIGGIGDQVHNLSCSIHGNDELQSALGDIASRLWDAAKSFSPEPAPAPSGWQDISTAPKDGTWFLGYYRRGVQTLRVRPYRWSERQATRHGNGWYFEGDGLHNPTHWMPLPPAPDAEPAPAPEREGLLVEALRDALEAKDAEIARLRGILASIVARADGAKLKCKGGEIVDAYGLASGILGQIGSDAAALRK